jgi:glycosyltransferase involved in cell wall biosynthesis
MTIGMLRVKNEARWIDRAIRSILPICDEVLVMDDHSDDDTAEICSRIPKVGVVQSPFTGLNETRDKNWLLERVRSADWIVCIDGDEMLAPGGIVKLQEAMDREFHSISMRIPYLWDQEDQVRMDGVYGEFRRHSAFRPMSYIFTSDYASGFHCGNVPWRARLNATTIDAKLLHFGYLYPEDRERKYCWYNAQDPGNLAEDRYRHIAAGLTTPHRLLIERQKHMRAECGLAPLSDGEMLLAAPKATEKTMHAGPLKLEAA